MRERLSMCRMLSALSPKIPARRVAGTPSARRYRMDCGTWRARMPVWPVSLCWTIAHGKTSECCCQRVCHHAASSDTGIFDSVPVLR